MGCAFQGIVVPGIDNANQASLPWFRITEWGKQCLNRGEYLPFDSGLFMERIRKEIPTLDNTIALYLVESLKCFRVGTFVASAVMMGVAAEQMMLVLRKAVYDSLATPEKKKTFETAAQGQIKRIYNAVWKKLDPVREQMPERLRELIGIELAGVFELVRKTRNDAGHPTGRRIERDEAEALLLLFPSYAKTVHEFVAWLATNPL